MSDEQRMAEELAAARETIRRLNRRCQDAESGLAAKLESHAEGGSLGRTLANSAARYYKAWLADTQAELRSAQQALGEAKEIVEELDAHYSEKYGISYRELRKRVEDVRGGKFVEHARAMLLIGQHLAAARADAREQPERLGPDDQENVDVDELATFDHQLPRGASTAANEPPRAIMDAASRSSVENRDSEASPLSEHSISGRCIWTFTARADAPATEDSQ